MYEEQGLWKSEINALPVVYLFAYPAARFLKLRESFLCLGQVMAISKKARFEIFKRDGFQCQYCGKAPPGIILEIDHIIPKKLKGTDNINNLITSCFDCNRGKGAKDLKVAPQNIKEKLEIIKEKETQLREYNKFLAKIDKQIQKEIEEIDRIYNSYFREWHFSDQFKNGALRRFLKLLPKQIIIDSMYIACGKMQDKHEHNPEDHAIRYFCGICWNRIREKNNA